MTNTVLYLETHSVDPAYNLAFEESVLNHRREGSYLLLWQNDRTVVVGQNQNTEAEINRAFIEAHQIRVVRRTTGGGAVYHDLGNLNYSFITDAGAARRLTMERFARPVADALRGLGLPAEVSGRNDILIDGKKISGTAQRMSRDRILHHGTLLFDTDPDMIAGALRVDPEKFRSKSTRSVRARVGNIRDFLPEEMDLPAFWSYLKTTLAGRGFVEDALSPEELRRVEALKRDKYDTWAWNFGASPACDVSNKRYWDGGGLEFQGAIRDGCLTEIHFYGDFLSLLSLEELTAALRGCPFRAEAVGARLDRFPLEQYFGAITKEQILKTIFYVHPSGA